MFAGWLTLLLQNLGMGGGPAAAPAAADPPRLTSTFDVSHTIDDTFNVGDYGRPNVIIDTRVYFVADIKRFKCKSTTKNGSPWTLTGVTFYLVDPSGNVSSHAATQTGPYEWSFDTVASGSGSLDEAGVWRRYWKPTDGSTPASFGAYQFTVRAIN